MPTALLLIDVINPFDFEGAERMVERAEEAAQRIRVLKDRAAEAGVPVIYCNDHFGGWQDDFSTLVERCRQPGTPGARIATLLAPEEDDYYVLKPKHSAFFRTPLATLLDDLEADRLILCGFAGDMCVLASAMEAYMRDYRLAVPRDCTASLDPGEDEHTLAYCRRVFDADTRPAADVPLE